LRERIERVDRSGAKKMAKAKSENGSQANLDEDSVTLEASQTVD